MNSPTDLRIERVSDHGNSTENLLYPPLITPDHIGLQSLIYGRVDWAPSLLIHFQFRLERSVGLGERSGLTPIYSISCDSPIDARMAVAIRTVWTMKSQYPEGFQTVWNRVGNHGSASLEPTLYR